MPAHNPALKRLTLAALLGMPWHIEERDGRKYFRGGMTGPLFDGGHIDTAAESRAQAMLTALHAHDDLVAALEIAEIAMDEETTGLPDDHRLRADYLKVKAALAKVRG